MRTLPHLLAITLMLPGGAKAIDIVVDYSLDTRNFFDTQEKKDAIEAAADRYSGIITSSLAEVASTGTETGTGPGWRIGLLHPGTGDFYEISTAQDEASDPLIALLSAPAADQYGLASSDYNPANGGLEANVWILYAGGRALPSNFAGIGGTATGTNTQETFDDPDGPLHRGVIPNTPGAIESRRDLPCWGGAVTFNSTVDWHFDLDTPPPTGKPDFYSVALHEIGHALGLATAFNQWPVDENGNYSETLSDAINEFNKENPSVNELQLESPSNVHFRTGSQKSSVFNFGSPDPNNIGIVPYSLKQTLLMEAAATFTGVQRRLELTNVDVGALEDVGWSVVSHSSPRDISQPDHRVGKTEVSSIGDDIYNTSSGQRITLTSRKARSVSGVLAVQNDSDIFDEFTVVGRPGNRFFRINYFNGSENVTSAVSTGTHTTGNSITIPSNQTHNIIARIKPNKRQLKKVIRRKGKRRVKFRKKNLSIVFRSVSVNDPRGRDFSIIRVQAR